MRDYIRKIIFRETRFAEFYTREAKFAEFFSERLESQCFTDRGLILRILLGEALDFQSFTRRGARFLEFYGFENSPFKCFKTLLTVPVTPISSPPVEE